MPFLKYSGAQKYVTSSLQQNNEKRGDKER